MNTHDLTPYHIQALQDILTPEPFYAGYIPPEPPEPRIIHPTGMGLRPSGFILQRVPMQKTPCYTSRVAFTEGKSYPETFVMQNSHPLKAEKGSKGSKRKPVLAQKRNNKQQPVSLFDRIFSAWF